MAVKSDDKVGVSNDVMSPYYISPSDNPSHVYVTDVLNDGNYGDWLEEMGNCLLAKNKYGFVDGSIPMPDDNSGDILLWKQCNAMVKGWLIVAMDKEIRNNVKHTKTTAEIWKDLGERFGKESAPKAYELKRTLTLTRQDKLSVLAYYTKLKAIWDDIDAISTTPKCTCGLCTCNIAKLVKEKVERERIYEFLMGLEDTFNTVRSQVLSMTSLPSLGIVYHLVAEDKRQRFITNSRNPTVDGAAFQVQRHITATDRRDGGGDKTPPQCGNCGKMWHTIDTCYEIVGYPKNRKTKGKKDGTRYMKKSPQQYRVAHVETSMNREANTMQNLTVEQLAQIKDFLNHDGAGASPKPSVNMACECAIISPWILYTGATEHICCEESLFERLNKRFNITPVKVPNGEYADVVGIGDIKLPSGLRLQRVLCVPSFQCNLISASRLAKDMNCKLIFYANHCVVQDLASKSQIGVAKQRGGLYHLGPVEDAKCAFRVTIGGETWHMRLGHASRLKLQGVCEVSDVVCNPCIRAKQTMLPFPSSTIKTSGCFELIHCDIWGGYKTPSLSGAYYFLTIVDDFSRGLWIYLMKFKSEVGKIH